MFNKYNYRFKLKLDVQYPTFHTVEMSVKDHREIEYSGASMREILEAVKEDFDLPDDFDFKSEFEYDKVHFKLKFLFWDTDKEVFDPFDELPYKTED